MRFEIDFHLFSRKNLKTVSWSQVFLMLEVGMGVLSIIYILKMSVLHVIVKSNYA